MTSSISLVLWAETSSAADEMVLLSLLTSSSGLEFEIFFQPFVVQLPFLIHTLTFCLLFPNMQAGSAVVRRQGSKTFHF